jgi:hypothetical protein
MRNSRRSSCYYWRRSTRVNLLIAAWQSGNLIGLYMTNTSGLLGNIQVFSYK